MLNVFRQRGISSVVYGVIIVATILVFVIQFRPNANQRTASIREACVVLVKGQCISPKSYRAAYRLLMPRDQSGNLLRARARQMGLGKIVADGLVERELLASEADRIGVRATPDEVDAEILNGFIHVSVPSDNPYLASSLRVIDGKVDPRMYNYFRDQKTKQFDYKVYERIVRTLTNKSATEFKEEQERELIAAKMREMIKAPIRVSETEARERYIDEKSNAKVAYVPVKTEWVARYAPQPSQADLDAWAKDKANEAVLNATMEQRKKDSLPVKDHIRHILVKVSPNATEEAHALALGRVAKAMQRIKAGEAFADVARDTSEDTGSAMHGGDVGDKTDGFVAPFKAAADALKPGEITPDAIETQFGYHLIMKDDPAKSAAVEAQLRKGAARSLYMKSKALELAKTIANGIAADIKAGKSPEEAAKAAAAPYVKAKDTVPALAVRPAEGGDNKERGADAGAADGGKASEKKAAVAAKAPTADNDPDRPEAQVSSAFNRGGDAIPDVVSGDASAQVTKFAFSSKDGDLMPEPIRTDDGFAVVQLKEHKAATAEEFEKDREAYVQSLLAEKQAEALALYVKRLKEAAKADFKIDESFTIEQSAKDGGAPTEDEDEGQ